MTLEQLKAGAKKTLEQIAKLREDMPDDDPLGAWLEPIEQFAKDILEADYLSKS